MGQRYSASCAINTADVQEPTTVDRSQRSPRECLAIQQKTNRHINATPHLYGHYIVKDAAAFRGDVNDLVCAINQVPATHKAG